MVDIGGDKSTFVAGQLLGRGSSVAASEEEAEEDSCLLYTSDAADE